MLEGVGYMSIVCGGFSLVFTLGAGWLLIKGLNSLKGDEQDWWLGDIK